MEPILQNVPEDWLETRIIPVLRQQIPGADPDPSAADRILQRIETELESWHSAFPGRAGRIFRPVALATVLALAVIAGFLIGRQGDMKLTERKQQQEFQELRTGLFIREMTLGEDLFADEK